MISVQRYKSLVTMGVLILYMVSPSTGIGNIFEIDENIIDVKFDSLYCVKNTQDHRQRDECDYKSTNKTVRLNSGYISSVLELLINNPTKLLFHPTCIPWISIINATYFTTLPPFDRLNSKCTTWIRIYNSTIDVLSHGVHDVYLENCTAKRINLSNQRDFQMENSSVEHLERLELHSYKAFIRDSNISLISRVLTTADLDVHNLTVGRIKFEGIQIRGASLTINGTTIQSVETHGVRIINSDLIIGDMVIENVYHFGIMVEDTTGVASVYLNNVTIKRCFAPCIYLPNRKNVIVKNVTIEGEDFNFDSKWIEEINATEFIGEVINKDTKGCTQPGQTLECNFIGIQSKTYLNFETVQNVSTVVIKNAYSLTVIVSVPHTLHNFTNMALIIQNSTIEVLKLEHAFDVQLDDSVVKVMSMEDISSFKFVNSSIDKLKYLSSRKESVIKSCVITDIQTTNFEGSVKILNSSIRQISGARFNHSGETSFIKDSIVSEIPYKGIHLLSGHLDMSDVHLSDLIHESVYLEKNATVSITNSQPLPSSAHQFVSVVDEKQVNLNFPMRYVETTWYYTVRNDRTDEENSGKQILITGDSYPSDLCRMDPPKALICFFDNANNSIVTLKDISIDIYYLQLSDIPHLNFHPFGGIEVSIRNATNGTIYKYESVLPMDLTIVDSYFIGLRCGAQTLYLKSSELTLFAPNTPVIRGFIEKSKIKLLNGVYVKEQLEISDSEIHVVEELLSHGSVLFNKTKVNLISTMGFTIRNQSKIINSEIGTVLKKGIIITGELLIENTSIDIAEDLAFDVFGKLSMRNVDIINGSTRSFHLRKSSFLSCKNVRINGKTVEVIQIFKYREDENTSKHPSTSTSTTTAKTTSSVHNEKETRKPYEDSIKSTHKPTFGHHHHSETTKKGMDNAGLTWLGAILGFILGGFVSVGILYTIMIFKPDSKFLLPAGVRWHEREDQHELVPSDDLGIPDGRMSSGY